MIIIVHKNMIQFFNNQDLSIYLFYKTLIELTDLLY